MNIHPKTSGTALGSAIGVLIVAILDSIHGVHMASELPAAITGFLSLLGAYIAPGATSTTVSLTTPVSGSATPPPGA